jgi:HAMP domain-containing protein
MSNDNASAEINDDGRARRSIRNILVKPREQLRYAFIFFGGGLSVMAIYIIMFLYYLNVTISNLSATYSISAEVQGTISTALLTASIATVVFAATLTLIMFAAGIALGHRIFGPSVPMLKLVQDLRKGDYSARGHLRKRDEFQDLMEELNALAATLEKKYGNQK